MSNHLAGNTGTDTAAQAEFVRVPGIVGFDSPDGRVFFATTLPEVAELAREYEPFAVYRKAQT